jgi:hypothetical protein
MAVDLKLVELAGVILLDSVKELKLIETVVDEVSDNDDGVNGSTDVLVGVEDESYSTIVGDIAMLGNVKVCEEDNPIKLEISNLKFVE